MSSERAAEAFGEWIGTIEDRVDDVEAGLHAHDESSDVLRTDLDVLEEDLAALEEKIENHKRAEFVGSVVSTFDDNGAVVTDFQLKDKDGAFLQGGGVELTIHAEAKDGDSDA